MFFNEIEPEETFLKAKKWWGHFKSKNLAYCPENIFIEEEDLCPYQINLLKGKKRPKVNKLVLSQTDKKNYIVHYRMLIYYLQQGMILKKVHRIISFT
jgi:hypothetical protein